MFDVTAETTFGAVGAFQSLSTDKNGTLYQGNATTITAPNGSITYNPRDGIFTIIIEDQNAGVKRNVRFQDPRHRQTGDAVHAGELQVPLLPGFNYLQSLDGNAQFTFFYQRPGTSGSFVSLAGFERSELNPTTGLFQSEQGAMVFGVRTADLEVPSQGTGRYDGQFLASMIGTDGSSERILQWITGSSGVDVDFAKRTVGLSLNGTVGPAFKENAPVNNVAVPAGTIFTAVGSANWTQASTAFVGRFSSAEFRPGSSVVPIDFTPVNSVNGVAGASSIDGAFYGPAVKNIGGNFRIVGGVPSQRIDIVGAFAGAKK